MVDRDKVIADLEFSYSTTLSGYALGNYGANIHGITSEILRDALTLLKAQEPRVMTQEEVKQWCEIHPHKQNPIWVEFQHGYGTNGWRVGLVNSGLLAWCKDNEARCWTSRPSDTQRKAAKWE